VRDDRNVSFLPSAENAGLVSDASPAMSAFGGADPSEGTIQMSPLRRPVWRERWFGDAHRRDEIVDRHRASGQPRGFGTDGRRQGGPGQ
jgi:hypothetical protein